LMGEVSPLAFSVNDSCHLVVFVFVFVVQGLECVYPSQCYPSQCYSLITLSFLLQFNTSSSFMVFLLVSFSVCRILCRIFCSGYLLLIYCFSFCLLWKTFIAPSILNDSFAR
jgi:hypothetical protein